MRTHKLTEHIRLATASRARARAPQQFEFYKRFGAATPRNGQFVSDLLDVPWLQTHFRILLSRAAAFWPPRERSRDRPSLLFAHQISPYPRAPVSRPPRFQLEN